MLPGGAQRPGGCRRLQALSAPLGMTASHVKGAGMQGGAPLQRSGSPCRPKCRHTTACVMAVLAECSGEVIVAVPLPGKLVDRVAVMR